MASKCDSDYVLPNNQPVVLLDCNVAFNALTKEEKLYAHHLSRACWNGGLIVLIQVRRLFGCIDNFFIKNYT